MLKNIHFVNFVKLKKENYFVASDRKIVGFVICSTLYRIKIFESCR